MAETFITQCPHCGTSFRVSDEQLSIANGSVRCGACLQVFSARNHIVTAAAAKAKSASRPAAPVAKAARPTVKKPSPGQRATAPEAAAAPKPKPASPASKPKPAKPAPPSRFAADDDDDADFLFEDNAEEDQEFVFQDSDDDLYDDDDSELGDLSDSFISLNNPSTGRKEANPFQREADDERDILDDPESADESWAESILEELEREESRDSRRQEKARSGSKPTSEPRPAKKQKNTQAAPAWSADDADDFDTVEFGRIDKSADDTATASSVVRQLNHDIDLDFNAEDRLARWRWLGAVFIVLLIAVLAAQLAWVQRDTYAKMDQWRGIYQSACDVLGCTLPEQQAVDLVRTSNVLIRDHRALNDVKLLDAVLTNRAAFKQPFPMLILQYTDVNGELVADQLFTPEQYLRGELTGTRLMPVNTRIYVSLPIRDPGSRAVNYQLVLAPSGTS